MDVALHRALDELRSTPAVSQQHSRSSVGSDEDLPSALDPPAAAHAIIATPVAPQVVAIDPVSRGRQRRLRKRQQQAPALSAGEVAPSSATDQAAPSSATATTLSDPTAEATMTVPPLPTQGELDEGDCDYDGDLDYLTPDVLVVISPNGQAGCTY